jgi:hypothetical protein
MKRQAGYRMTAISGSRWLLRRPYEVVLPRLPEPRESKTGSYALKVGCRIPFTFREKAYRSPFAN